MITHPPGRYTWHHTDSHRSEIEIEKYNGDSTLVVVRIIEASPGSIQPMPVLHANDAYERVYGSGGVRPKAGNYAVNEISDGLRRKSLRDGQRLSLKADWPDSVRLTPLAAGQHANTHCK